MRQGTGSTVVAARGSALRGSRAKDRRRTRVRQDAPGASASSFRLNGEHRGIVLVSSADGLRPAELEPLAIVRVDMGAGMVGGAVDEGREAAVEVARLVAGASVRDAVEQHGERKSIQRADGRLVPDLGAARAARRPAALAARPRERPRALGSCAGACARVVPRAEDDREGQRRGRPGEVSRPGRQGLRPRSASPVVDPGAVATCSEWLSKARTAGVVDKAAGGARGDVREKKVVREVDTSALTGQRGTVALVTTSPAPESCAFGVDGAPVY